MWGRPVFLLGSRKMLSTQLSSQQLVSVCVGIGNPPYAAMFKDFPCVHVPDDGKA